MSTSNRGVGPESPSASSAKDPGTEGLPERLQRLASQRPPPPKGKGVVMAILMVAVLAALIYQFASGTGAGKAVRDRHAQSRGPDSSPLAPEDPDEGSDAGDPAHPLGAPPPPPESERVESPPPSAMFAMPEGLDERTANRLRTALASLTHRRLEYARSGIHELPYIVAETPEEDRPRVRALVVEHLTPVMVGHAMLSVAALDAALALALEDPKGLEALREVAQEVALERDETAAAALVFLSALPAEERKGTKAALMKLAKDEKRPLHLRKLAQRQLEAWQGD